VWSHTSRCIHLTERLASPRTKSRPRRRRLCHRRSSVHFRDVGVATSPHRSLDQPISGTAIRAEAIRRISTRSRSGRSVVGTRSARQIAARSAVAGFRPSPSASLDRTDDASLWRVEPKRAGRWGYAAPPVTLIASVDRLLLPPHKAPDAEEPEWPLIRSTFTWVRPSWRCIRLCQSRYPRVPEMVSDHSFRAAVRAAARRI
jgi:hypothetical protein